VGRTKRQKRERLERRRQRAAGEMAGVRVRCPHCGLYPDTGVLDAGVRPGPPGQPPFRACRERAACEARQQGAKR